MHLPTINGRGGGGGGGREQSVPTPVVHASDNAKPLFHLEQDVEFV